MENGTLGFEIGGFEALGFEIERFETLGLGVVGIGRFGWGPRTRVEVRAKGEQVLVAEDNWLNPKICRVPAISGGSTRI